MAQHHNRIKPGFEETAFQHVERLFRLAYARVANVHDAEDIVQETYLRAYRSYGSFRHDADVGTWLTQILVNIVRDHFRRSEHTFVTLESEEMLAQCVDEPSLSSTEEQICQSEFDPALTAALRQMPHGLVIPLLLKEIHDASYEQIARIMDIPMGTVMSRLFRARALLRRKLLSAPGGHKHLRTLEDDARGFTK